MTQKAGSGIEERRNLIFLLFGIAFDGESGGASKTMPSTLSLKVRLGLR